MLGKELLEMDDKRIPIIHVSEQPMALSPANLGKDFNYIWLNAAGASLEMEGFPEKPLFNPKTERLAKDYLNAVFLLDPTFPWLDDATMLGKLPANQIYYQENLAFSDEAQAMLKLRGAMPYDLTQVETFARDMRYYYFLGADGYRSDAVNWRFGPRVLEPAKQFGRVYSEVEVDFGDWTLTAYLDAGADQSNYIPPHVADRIQLEYQVDVGVEIMLKVNMVSLDTKQILGSETRFNDDIVGGIDLLGGNSGFMSQILVYTKGKGHIKIGNMHVRRSRGPFGTFMPNDGRVINSKLHDDVTYYFDAGDMKPPLNVYFSGWRTKEGYEGNMMMRGMNAPYLLIGDQRLEGGAFYMGDENFEQTILDVIQDKLKILNFDMHDVIIAGMSMGTYGALYYGSQLSPKGIVVGKPLTNLGFITQNGRVKRPDDFHTAEDIQLYYEGDLSEVASDRLDQRFWDKFNKGDLSQTTLALAYMEQDDYDNQAFYRIQKSVKERFENARVLSKGFEGRHNDNTFDVVQWFQFQYHKLLAEYGRE